MCCGSKRKSRRPSRGVRRFKPKAQVVSLAEPLKTIFMCRPDYFKIQYSINPWMDLQNQAKNSKAIEDWNFLCDRIREFGGKVITIKPQDNLPDMVFTANAGLIVKDKKLIVLSHFRHDERKNEEMWFLGWFLEQGYDVKYPSMPFEGAGDALYLGDTLVCGHGFRTEAAVYDEIAKHLTGPHELVRLINPKFYHLDTCFCPLNELDYLYYSGAFDAESAEKIRSLGGDGFDVPQDEAERFACNAVVIGQTVILPKGCEATKQWLIGKGYQTSECDMSEFLKSGGACKCLTLAI